MLSNREDATQTSTVRDERHEPARNGGEIRGALGGLDVDPEILLVVRADRDHEPAVRLELLEKRGRRPTGGGRDGNASKRRLGGQAHGAVAVVHMNPIGVTRCGESCTRAPQSLVFHEGVAAASGTTLNAVNDGTGSCGGSGPDVLYTFTTTGIGISLCLDATRSSSVEDMAKT